MEDQNTLKAIFFLWLIITTILYTIYKIDYKYRNHGWSLFGYKQNEWPYIFYYGLSRSGIFTFGIIVGVKFLNWYFKLWQ